jgi:hypothetical protein
VVRAGGKFALAIGLHFCYTEIMRKSITVTQKKRGRPATGVDPLVTTRLPEEMIADIKAWAAQNHTSRSDAIRQLIAAGLAAAPAPRKAKK